MLNSLDAHVAPVIFGNGEQAYDFIDARDCAAANILSMASSVTNSCFNVGTGIKTSIKDLAEYLVSSHPYPRDACFDFKKNSLVKNRIGDIKRAWQDLGFKSAISLQTGLTDLITWRESQKMDTDESNK
jgi:UDP-glucose 4-epimerase